MNSEKTTCGCGMPEKWAKDPNFPIEYDSETNEYHIVGPGPLNIRYLISFCPECGGRMPASKRDSFFTTPEENEVEEMKKLMKTITNVDQMHAILGPPDATFQASLPPEFYDLYEIKKSKAQFIYSKRWATLALYVVESTDGSISYTWSGREINPREEA